MEELIEGGIISGVLDLTTHELTEEVVGSGAYMPVRPGRLVAAGRTGIPQVVSMGGLVSLGDVKAEANILCDLDESILDSPLDFKPSKEASFHLSVYRLRTDVMAIAHLHPPYATAYANQASPLPLVTVSSRVNLKMVPWIESALPGSKELRELVSEAIRKYPGIRALLMKEHGILTMGPDLKTAYYLADLVEDTAKIAFIASNIAR